MNNVRKAVIPAGGLGSRFYPLTRAQPKEMLPLLDKPVIHYVVEEAVNSGLDEILIIVGAGKDAIINYFDKSTLDETFNDNPFGDLPDIYFVRQKEPKGLADSLKYAKKFVDDETFVVLLGDTVYRSNSNIPITKQLLNSYSKLNKPVIALEKVPREMTVNYGIISGELLEDKIYSIKELIEKPQPENSPSDLGITGLYALEPNIFNYLSQIKPGKNNELQLTDALSLLANEGELYGFEISGTRYDIGSMELWIKSFVDFLKRSEKYSKLI